MLVNELLAIDKAEEALFKANPLSSGYDIPGYADLEDRHFEIIDLIAEAEVAGIHGLQAKARALQTPGVEGDWEAIDAVAASLAADLLRLYPIEVA